VTAATSNPGDTAAPDPSNKKESPDVETPGLLVKALISSFFMFNAVYVFTAHIFSKHLLQI